MSSRGHQRERAVRDVLLDDNWVVVRAAGSLGAVDLVALKAGRRPRLIEVKSTIGPYDHFGPADRADISVRAVWAGADAELAWWPKRGKLRWIPEAEWPAARVTCVPQHTNQKVSAREEHPGAGGETP
jgi:Holliday junction resolvase